MVLNGVCTQTDNEERVSWKRESIYNHRSAVDTEKETYEQVSGHLTRLHKINDIALM